MEEVESVLTAAWSTVVNSAMDPAMCLVFAETFLSPNVDARSREESSMWETLLPAAASDALLELSCLKTLKGLDGRSPPSLGDASKTGDALANKVRKTLANPPSAASSSVLASEVDLSFVQKNLSICLRACEPSDTTSPPENEVSSRASLPSDNDNKKEYVLPSDIRAIVQRAMDQADKLERGGDTIMSKLDEVLDALKSFE